MRRFFSLPTQKAIRGVLALALLLTGFSFGPVTKVTAAATLTVSSDTAAQATFSAVVAGADRLLALQADNGSWDWVVTGQSSASGTTYLNISGVTAQGLLSAYALTHAQKYLDGAIKTGDYIINQVGTLDLTKKINGHNIVFLYDLGQANGDLTYTTAAQNYFDHMVGAANALCASGCTTAQELIDGQKGLRGVASTPDGIIPWDLMNFVRAAKVLGSADYASSLADALKAYVIDTNYTDSVANYDLGLAAAIYAEAFAGGNSTEVQTTLNERTTAIQGLVEPIQVSAYAALALKNAGANSSAFSDFLLSAGSNGVWLENAVEYSESDSETVQALAATIQQSNVYYRIQDAVNAASDGDVINISAGTYSEQVVINKELTINGAGRETTIINVPSVLVGDSFGDKSVVSIGNAKTVSINDLQIAGPGNGSCGSVKYGIYVGGSATANLTDIKVDQLRDEPMSGCQTGIGIRYGSDFRSEHASGTITRALVTNYQKGGIVIDGIGSDVTVKDSTVTGVGATPLIAQNGIQISRGATGTLQDNIISDNECDHITCGPDYLTKDQSAGILLYNAGDMVKILRNDVSHNDIGVYNSLLSAGKTLISANNLSGNRYEAIQLDAGDADVVANIIGGGNIGVLSTSTGTKTLTNNQITGATHDTEGDGLTITTQGVKVETPTFVVDPGLTTGLNLTIPDDVLDPKVDLASFKADPDDNELNLAHELVIDSATSNGDVEVTIPAGVTITGPAGWDGTLQAPKVSTESVSTHGSAVSVSALIKVGLDNQSLSFDKPVRLLLAGKAGLRAGYIGSDNILKEIATTCTSDDIAAVQALFALDGIGECKVDVGGDLAIWTNHFTTFAAYTEVSTPGGSGGSSSSGGGSGSGSTPPPVVVVPPVAVNPPAVNIPVNDNNGRVLGEITVNAHPEGTFVRDGKTISLVLQGQLRSFATFQEFKTYGNVKFEVASDADKLLPAGPIMKAKEGSFIRDPKGKTVYLIENETKRGFTNYAAFRKYVKNAKTWVFDISSYPEGEVISQ